MSATLPGDLARWTFWVGLRGVIHPSLPGLINALGTGWRLRWASAQEDRTLMEDEYRRWLGDTLTDQGFQTLVRHAYRSAWRVHLEELLLSRLGPNNIDDWAQIRGEDRLRDALSDEQGVILVYPHAGPVMLMIAALAHKGFPYVQYAARGLAPADMAREHPDLLAHSRLRAAVRTAREAHENCLDVEYLTLDAPVRTLHRRLADNHIVGIAFDGRIGSGWAPMPFLNRTALLSPGPWKLACSTGATVLPVFCHTPDGEPATIEVGRPVKPGEDWRSVATEALDQQEEWLRRHPEEYGLWLLHTRQRAGIDDHPLFIDTAIDTRYRCWMPDE
jgi:lauroyl/myristoyl acyltransferase